MSDLVGDRDISAVGPHVCWPSAFLSASSGNSSSSRWGVLPFFFFSEWLSTAAGPPCCKEDAPACLLGLIRHWHHSPLPTRAFFSGSSAVWRERNCTQSHALCMLVMYCNKRTARAPPTTCCPFRVLFLSRENVCPCGETLRFSSAKTRLLDVPGEDFTGLTSNFESTEPQHPRVLHEGAQRCKDNNNVFRRPTFASTVGAGKELQLLESVGF